MDVFLIGTNTQKKNTTSIHSSLFIKQRACEAYVCVYGPSTNILMLGQSHINEASEVV